MCYPVTQSVTTDIRHTLTTQICIRCNYAFKRSVLMQLCCFCLCNHIHPTGPLIGFRTSGVKTMVYKIFTSLILSSKRKKIMNFRIKCPKFLRGDSVGSDNVLSLAVFYGFLHMECNLMNGWEGGFGST